MVPAASPSTLPPAAPATLSTAPRARSRATAPRSAARGSAPPSTAAPAKTRASTPTARRPAIGAAYRRATAASGPTPRPTSRPGCRTMPPPSPPATTPTATASGATASRGMRSLQGGLGVTEGAAAGEVKRTCTPTAGRRCTARGRTVSAARLPALTPVLTPQLWCETGRRVATPFLVNNRSVLVEGHPQRSEFVSACVAQLPTNTTATLPGEAVQARAPA